MKWFSKLARIELVLIYLVIIAGSVVRMTGSGMGCPDWPKCFGYLIPPTERSQLEWQAHREFKKGQIIIVDETLRLASSDFTSSNFYDESNWQAYTKHDYAHFNPFHTWTEYINRLFGALSGLPMFMLFVLSLFYLKRDWKMFILSFLGLFMLGFEAWLGKLVVDGNLVPGSITIHMMGALLIVAILCLILIRSNPKSFSQKEALNGIKWLLAISLLLTIIQIISGTQIREQIDHFNHDGLERREWIKGLDWKFYFHRSFSIAIVLLNFWLWKLNRKKELGFKLFNWILALIGLEIMLGIILSYFNMPQFAQPSHLLLGTFIFGLQFFALAQIIAKDNLKQKN